MEVIHALHGRHCFRRGLGGRGADGGSQNGADAHRQEPRQRPRTFTHAVYYPKYHSTAIPVAIGTHFSILFEFTNFVLIFCEKKVEKIDWKTHI